MNDFRCASCRIYYGAGKGGNRIIHCDRHSEAHVTALTQSLECGQKDCDYLRGRLEAVEKERDGLQHMNKLMHERCHELEHGAPPVGHCIYEQNKAAESELKGGAGGVETCG